MTNTTQTRSWKKTLIVGAVALSTLAGAGFTAAQAHGWKDGRGNGEYGQMQKGGQRGDWGRGERGQGGFSQQRLERFFTMIEATPEQKEQITTIFNNLRDSMQDRRDNRDDTRAEMRDQITALLKAPEFDREAAQNLLESRDAMREDAKTQMETALLDAVEVLTPEQREKVASFVADRGGMFFGGERGHGPRN